jgi:pimeloyl-ACP methyl ester carboxylesterase
MPIASVNGVDLHFEDTGQGVPLVWSHEFGGDHRSWEPQVRHFSRRYRVITYNPRGYPPSSVPKGAPSYSQDLLVEDLHQLMRNLGLRDVHLAGCSMGANVARDFAIAHPEMLRSLCMVGAGAGSVNREQYLAGHAANAAAMEREGIGAISRNFDGLPARAAFKRKDPRGFAEFLRQVEDHDAQACAHLSREVMSKRKTVPEVEAGLRGLRVPTLIVVGDEDGPCVEPSFLMRRLIPYSGLLVFPSCGHTVNIEEPTLFNMHVSEFLAAVDNGHWAGWSA